MESRLTTIAATFMVVAVCALAAPTAEARGLTVKIDTRKAAINEFFELTVQVNGSHVRLLPPKTDSFRIENTTNSFNQPMFCMNMGLNIMSGPCVYTFRFYPKKAGELKIPRFRLIDDFWNPGRLLGKSASFEVEVSKKPAKGGKAEALRKREKRKKREGRIHRGRTRTGKRRSGNPRVFEETEAPVPLADLRVLDRFADYDLFLVPFISEDSVYLNQPFKVDFLLYAGDGSGASSLQGLELPDLEGFRKEQIELQEEERRDVVIKGKSYTAYLLSRYILMPMEPGKRTLSSAKATVLASVSHYEEFSGSGFSVSFRSGTQPVQVYSPPVLLDIRTVPQPVPDGFVDTNVGRFELTNLEVPPSQPVGSWVVLKYDIEATGNLLSFAPPALPALAQFENRPAYVDSSGVVVDSKGIHGKVQVQLPFRMKRAGSYSLPPLRLVYFDPLKAAFGRSTLELPELTAVEPGEAGGTASTASLEELEGIVPDASLDRAYSNAPAVPAGWVIGYAAGMPMLYLLAVLAQLLLRVGGNDTPRRRRRVAVASARKDLARAGKLVGTGSTDQFYSLLARALSSYLEGRFSISVGSTILDGIEQGLARQGVPGELTCRVREELESSEFGRFAPSSIQEGDMEAALRRAVDLLAQLDKVKTRR